MASDPSSKRKPDLTESSMTLPSDSENYSSSNNESSPSPPSSSSSPLILYSPPTLWGLLRGAAINLLLPFVNGLMLGFGELLAHEAAFRLGWSGTKVFPSGRTSRPVGPGVEMREDPSRRKRSERELEEMTSLE
ncbi:MAG: hypothetical protein LQ350_001763 [Teloschistes chrysophthalmus]|nr:MAG: hypothetical protein LQ350_001763 [Niorma chrysophthalma]